MRGALARRMLTCAVIGSMSLVVPASPAAAYECLEPDAAPPIMYGFVVQPSPARMGAQDLFGFDPSDVGTRIDVTVDDNLHHREEYNGSNPNLVVEAVLTVDSGAITQTMRPVSGRYGRIIQPVFAIVPFHELSPGVHDIRVTAEDSCGNVSRRDWRVFHTPAATATCENAPRGLCN